MFLTLNSLDIVFLGTYDLSKSLGIPGDVSNKKVTNTVEKLTYKINQAGKFSGTIATDIQQIDQYLAMGMQYIVYLVDCYVLKKGYMEAVDHFRLRASIPEKD